MAEKSAAPIGDNTPEFMAYRLLHEIMASEKMSPVGGGDTKRADRKYILDTYAECMMAIKSPETRRR